MKIQTSNNQGNKNINGIERQNNKQLLKDKEANARTQKQILFKKYQKLIVELVSESKQHYYKCLFEKNKTICRAIRKAVNEIIFSKHKN